jgi:hypothetical protein
VEWPFPLSLRLAHFVGRKLDIIELLADASNLDVLAGPEGERVFTTCGSPHYRACHATVPRGRRAAGYIGECLIQ